MSNPDWLGYIQQSIQTHHIQSIRVCMQDSSNVSRSRQVSTKKFLEDVMSYGLSVPSALFAFDSSAVMVPGAGPGEHSGYPSWHLQPDLLTFSVLPYAPGVARIIADVYDDVGQPVQYAPRHVLQRLLKRMENAGFQVQGSFEFEFYAFMDPSLGAQAKGQNSMSPVRTDLSSSDRPSFDSTPRWTPPAWSGLQCFSEVKQSKLEPLLMSLLKTLEDMGAAPQVANTEYGPGQFEISYAPFWGVEIADMAFYYRTTIKEVFAQHGLKASFMSKPLNGFSGSGAHLHHALYRPDGSNAFFDPTTHDGLSQICKWFIGGQLAHARTISALMNSTVNSYKRLQPHTFAPYTASWGYDQRETMVRVPGVRQENTRVENRLPGADTDPYLALAAAIAAGLDGIEQRIDPGVPAQGANLGNYPPLPRSLSEALLVLKEDEWAQTTLGEDFMSQFLKLRFAEVERFMRYVTDWETQEYADIF